MASAAAKISFIKIVLVLKTSKELYEKLYARKVILARKSKSKE